MKNKLIYTTDKIIVQSENNHYIFHFEQDIPFFKQQSLMFYLSYLLILLKESNQENILISITQSEENSYRFQTSSLASCLTDNFLETKKIEGKISEENNYLEVSYSSKTSSDENGFYYHFILEELKPNQLIQAIRSSDLENLKLIRSFSVEQDYLFKEEEKIKKLSKKRGDRGDHY